MIFINDKKDLPISLFVHNDRLSYVAECYGGKKVGEWPFYQFIYEYLHGDEQNARNDWVAWLEDQYSKYGTIEKSKGGMKGGSVYKGAMKNLNRQVNNIEHDSLTAQDIRVGAELLVDRRLSLVRSIRDDGFIPGKGDRIIALMRHTGSNRVFVLQGGHHRLATLYSLGYESLPNIRII